MTEIDWNEYVSVEREFEERAVKNEGEFAIASIGPVNGDEFYKLHIGLYNGTFLRSDGLELQEDQLSSKDRNLLTTAVGSPP